MTEFRPLLSRGTEDPAFDGPVEGIPAYMGESVRRWVSPHLRWSMRTGTGGSRWAYKRDLMQEMEVALRDDPLDWSDGEGFRAYADVMNRIPSWEDFTLNLLDFLVGREKTDDATASKLDDLLTRGGSAWEVAPAPQGFGATRQLVRRSLGPVREVIEDLQTDSQRAHHHLMTAWSRLAGRNPDASIAYREAIRAVEAVARPIVTPNDPKATLGKMIAALRDKPDKWEVVLENVSATDIADMADTIWSSQLDRHGTDEADAPLSVSQEQADAAVHISIALVRIFGGRLIRPVGS